MSYEESPGALVDADHYFTIEELRAEYPELSNETKYTDAKLEADRAYAEQWFEAALHAAYLPREATKTLTGNGRRILFLPHWVEVGPVTAVEIDGIVLDAAALAELEAENERLKCCGNCGLWSMSGWCTSEVTRYGTGRLNSCIWEPSRWAARETP